MSASRSSGDDFVVHVPPPGEFVPLRRFDDALDFVFLLQPADDAMVALCDEHRHVLLVIETAARHLSDVPALAGRLDAVSSAIVFTCVPVDLAPPEDSLLAWHQLQVGFESEGLELVDWLQVDDELVRSLAETAGHSRPWP